MRLPTVLRNSGHVSRICLPVLAAAVTFGASPAFGQTSLTVNGELVIQGGGTNTSTIRYSGITVDSGTGSTTISLSAAYPTLVVRGPAHYAETCNSAADCWDANECVEKTATTSGVCGWSGIELPQGCASSSGLAGDLDACAHAYALEQRDPNARINVEMADSCVAAASLIPSLGASCPIQQFRDAYDKVVYDVIAGSLNNIQTTSGGSLIPADLATHLNRIGRWYDGYRANYPASGGNANNDLVWSQTSRVLGSFWNAVYEKSGVSHPNTSDPVVLDSLFGKSLEADRTVLLAALTNPVPIQTAPLVELMGDALQSMSTRLGQVSLYHDLGCRFRNNPSGGRPPCAQGGVRTVRSEISELIHLVSETPDPVGLTSILTSPTPGYATANWGNWAGVFQALRSQHASTFQHAVLDALPGASVYAPGLIEQAPTQMTPPLKGLAHIVQDARLRSDSYDLTGLFDSRSAGVLEGGVHDGRLAAVGNLVHDWTAELRAEVSAFDSARLVEANAVLAEMTNLESQQRIEDDLAIQFADQTNMRSDLAGIRTNIEVEQARFGEFMQAYNEASALVENDPVATQIQHLLVDVTVKPEDAHWPAPPADPSDSDVVAAFAARPAGLPFPIAAAKGTILNFQITGKWSPSCALQTSQYEDPVSNQEVSLNVPSPADTGPEGYLVTLVNGTYVATSNTSVRTTEQYSNVSTSHKSCGGFGFNLGLGGPIPNPTGIPISGSASVGYNKTNEKCTTYDSGTRTSQSTSSSSSNGAETRMSAAFVTGIRLPNTPFPNFPAGSLLLVEVAPGGSERADIRDVQVLQEPSSSIILSDDADVYLVVNDIARGGVGTPQAVCAPDPKGLAVSINGLVPWGTVAQQLGAGMASALATLRAKESSLVEQGRVGPEQMAALRAGAFNDLVAACGSACTGDLSYYPPEILRFFDAWVSNALAIIERKVDARTLERQIALIGLKQSALAHDIEHLSGQARLLTLIPTWMLRDLDTRIMETDTQNLLSVMIAHLYPLIDLKYPGTLTSQYLDANRLNTLLGQTSPPLDWTGRLTPWADAAADASDNILNTLNATKANTPPLTQRTLLLGIPNALAGGPSGGAWPRVGPQEAQAVWDAIMAGETFVPISVTPAQLFAGTTDRMFCNNADPVITAMAIYMVRPGHDADIPYYAGLTVPVFMGRDAAFPDVGIVKNYRVEAEDWVNQDVAVLSGDVFADPFGSSYGGVHEQLADLFADTTYYPGVGMSPFTQFDLSLSGITSPVWGAPALASGATEMVLGFRVEMRNVSGLGLPPMCQ